MAKWIDTVYRRCPVWVQTAGIAAYGLAWRRRRGNPRCGPGGGREAEVEDVDLG